MEIGAEKQWMMAEQITRFLKQSSGTTRLRNFIRKRVADPGDAEDIPARGLLTTGRGLPDDEAGGAGYRLAVPGGAHRITDLFRKAKAAAVSGRTGRRHRRWETLRLEDLLPSLEAGPEAAYCAQCFY